MNEDYLLDEDDFDSSSYYDVEDQDDDGSNSSIDETDEDSGTRSIDESEYKDKLTKNEVWLSSAYDDIVLTGKNNKINAIEDAATIVVMANPKHTSSKTISDIIKEMFHKQGHSRMVNSLYTPDSPISGEDVDMDYIGEDDSGFNKMYADAAREQISNFIEYLASRDLSKDSIMSRRRKQRHIPAFIILLFSSGMYDLILNCPTMPEEYDIQIKQALQKIMKAKYDIVEALASKYESAGRDIVAERVRKLQLSWFLKEPAEIRTSAEYSDLELTHNDVIIYREYRSKFTNMSKSITQEVISDMIEVVIDADSGIYEKLKDKTRSDAIADVKQVYTEWSKDAEFGTELSNRVIYKDKLGVQ